jgi:hypothetical protein
VLYDPFVERALEPWSFGIYAGGQSILVGTPAGVTLAPEGGAHQSIKTPSIGLEQPGCVAYEPAFVVDTEWVLLASLAQIGEAGGRSASSTDGDSLPLGLIASSTMARPGSHRPEAVAPVRSEKPLLHPERAAVARYGQARLASAFIA